jgi:tetratricopeptide (TPR) repeat protein
VKPQLIDLYCNTGQPEKALDLLTVGQLDDPNLGSEPGAAAMRQGLVYYLLGNYFSASSLWQERSIPKVRFERSSRVLTAGRALLRGEAFGVINSFMSLPQSLNQQGAWEYSLALCQLEAGLPDLAATNFLKALELQPELNVRPIAVYYLEKMGKTVPPLPPKKPGAATFGTRTGRRAASPALQQTRPMGGPAVPAPRQ